MLASKEDNGLVYAMYNFKLKSKPIRKIVEWISKGGHVDKENVEDEQPQEECEGDAGGSSIDPYVDAFDVKAITSQVIIRRKS